MPLVYSELQRIARRFMRREGTARTLQTTALVHEAFLRFAGAGPPRWENQKHFFAASAVVMRRILVDLARERHRIKRGGPVPKIAVDPIRSQRRPASIYLSSTRQSSASPRLNGDKARSSNCATSADCPSRKSPQRLTFRCVPFKRTGDLPALGSTASSRKANDQLMTSPRWIRAPRVPSEGTAAYKRSGERNTRGLGPHFPHCNRWQTSPPTSGFHALANSAATT